MGKKMGWWPDGRAKGVKGNPLAKMMYTKGKKKSKKKDDSGGGFVGIILLVIIGGIVIFALMGD